MSAIGSSSPFQTIPDEIDLHIFSFLEERDLQAIACTCRKFEALSKDFQIWKPKTEAEFGTLVANGAKQLNKSWKKTYEELDASRETRIQNTAKILQTQIKKTTQDDIQYRSAKAASALFGFAMPNSSIHYYPTGQTGSLGNRKITVFKSTQ